MTAVCTCTCTCTCMYYKVAKIFVVHVVDSWVVAILGCLGTWVVYTIHVECLS